MDFVPRLAPKAGANLGHRGTAPKVEIPTSGKGGRFGATDARVKTLLQSHSSQNPAGEGHSSHHGQFCETIWLLTAYLRFGSPESCGASARSGQLTRWQVNPMHWM